MDRNNAKVQEYEQILLSKPKEQTEGGLLLLTNDNWQEFFVSPFIFDKEESESTVIPPIPQIPQTPAIPSIPQIPPLPISNPSNVQTNINDNDVQSNVALTLPSLESVM